MVLYLTPCENVYRFSDPTEFGTVTPDCIISYVISKHDPLKKKRNSLLAELTDIKKTMEICGI